MNDRAARRLLTIGQLAELTGVPVRTIRFYSDTLYGGAPIVEPVTRNPAGYRLYDIEAAARLELVRTLRDLDIDLPTIARVLAKEVTVAEVARTHADALEATIKVIRLRQAVLRAVAARDSDWMEMELMHRLAKLTAAERQRILDGYLDRVFGGLDPVESGRGDFEQMMRSSFPDLPEDATPEQVEAWVELVSMIQDDDYIARCRQMAEHGAAKRAGMNDEQWQCDQTAFGSVLVPEAAKAYSDGVAPDSPAARARIDAIVTAWAQAADVPNSPQTREELAKNVEMFLDERVYRFWALVGVVNKWDASRSAGMAPSFESMDWLAKALRAAL